MVKNESENTEQVLKAITALKDKAEEPVDEDGVSKGPNLESIVRKLARKRERQTSSK